MKTQKSFDTRKLVLLALLTAIVIVLQLMGTFIKFGIYSISAVLLPIAIGSALVGAYAGGWLGFVFGFVVLFSPDVGLFMAFNPFMTIVVVLLKGTLAGFVAGVAYRLIAKKNRTVAAIAAAVLCPIVNTGIFLIGTYLFFIPPINELIATGQTGTYVSATEVIFLGMIGGNFLFELGLNLVLSPTIVRLIQYGQDSRLRN